MADTAQQIATLIAGLGLSDEQITLLTQNLATLKQNSLNELDDAVAKAREGTKLTRHGFELMGKAVAGQELHFTRVALGDATVNGQTYTDTHVETIPAAHTFGPPQTANGKTTYHCSKCGHDFVIEFNITEEQ